MLLDEAERLGVDERPQHRLERLDDELAQLLGRVALEDAQAVLGRRPHRLVARAARDEQELPGSRLQQLGPRDQAALAERAGERERRGAAQERPVEVEERGGGHGALRPQAGGRERLLPAGVVLHAHDLAVAEDDDLEQPREEAAAAEAPETDCP